MPSLQRGFLWPPTSHPNLTSLLLLYILFLHSYLYPFENLIFIWLFACAFSATHQPLHENTSCIKARWYLNLQRLWLLFKARVGRAQGPCWNQAFCVLCFLCGQGSLSSSFHKTVLNPISKNHLYPGVHFWQRNCCASLSGVCVSGCC